MSSFQLLIHAVLPRHRRKRGRTVLSGNEIWKRKTAVIEADSSCGRFSVLEPMAQKIGKRKAEAIVTGHSPAGEEKDIA